MVEQKYFFFRHFQEEFTANNMFKGDRDENQLATNSLGPFVTSGGVGQKI